MDQLLINQLLQAQQVAIKAQEVTITALQDENKNLKIEVDKLNKELAQRFSSSKFLKLKTILFILYF